MTEPELKDKLLKWLAIKGEADSLEKAVHEKAPGYREDQGMSEAGRMTRYAHNAVFAGPGNSMNLHKDPEHAAKLFSGAAKEQHKKILGALQSMKKPNLPKSELDKGSCAVLAASEKLDKNAYLKNMMSQLRQQKGLPNTPQAGETLDYSKMKSQPVTKEIVHNKQGMHVAPVYGQKTNKLFDPRLSGTSKPQIKKNAQPALVSDPVTINTVVQDNPKEINSPVTVNSYKDKK